jgi:hypothetical protein
MQVDPTPRSSPAASPKHLATENVRSQLAHRGIQAQAARHAAMLQLAANICPPPILAEILGLAPHAATRWAALASRTGASTPPHATATSTAELTTRGGRRDRGIVGAHPLWSSQPTWSGPTRP